MRRLTVLLLSAALFLHARPPDDSLRTSAPWYENISADVELSNLSYESLKNETKIGFETEISNTNSDKYSFDFTFSYDYDEDKDPYDKSSVTDEETEAELTFDLLSLFHNRIDYSSYISYDQQKNNSDYTDIKDVDIAPLGIKFRLFKGTGIEEISVSYLPLLNYYQYYNVSDYLEEIEAELIRKTEKALHHTFKFIFEAKILSGKIEIKNKFFYKIVRPFDKIVENDDDYRDNVLENKFHLRYYLSDFFAVGYRYDINVDDRRRRTQGLPLTNQINSITITFSWDGNGY